MSLAEQALIALDSAHEFFNRSTRNLTEAQSTYAPGAGMMTAAQHVAHAAQTIDWFIEGAFRPEGFALDFEEQARQLEACRSLEQARAWFDRAINSAKAKVALLGDNELLALLPEGPVMGGVPRFAVFGAITDHTAHHRGALTVYARLNGIVPPMPYMEMPAAAGV